jgi:hypothetical protein
MSLALIQESAKEVRRIAIAGSPLAVGDFRLKKLIAPLEQAGAKVPVFAQVAKAITDLVQGKEADSAANLLSLSTLLNAILYTQGQTGTAASSPAFEEMKAYHAGTGTTRTAARILKPVIQALTTSGGGRFETVRAAHKRGVFNDLRLVEPAIRALDDTFPEMADLVAEEILPSYGPGIAPLLKEKFDVKGKRSDARRLLVLHKLDPNGSLELCKTALEDGSPEVKVAAVACLGKHEEYLPLVQEQANSKNKAVRAAALEALAGHDQPGIAKLFTDLIKGKSLELLAGPFRVLRNAQVVTALLDEGKRVFDLVVKGDENHLPRFSEILDCLHFRTDTDSETFLITCLNQSEKLGKVKAPKNSPLAGADVLGSIVSMLYRRGTPKVFDALLARRDSLPGISFSEVLRSALRSWEAGKVYDEFSPLLSQKKGAGKSKSEELQRTIWASRSGNLRDYFEADVDPDSDEEDSLRKVEWDPRWLDAALKADQQLAISALARAGHKGAIAYFLKLGEGKNLSEAGLVVEGLARCEYPKITEVFLGLVTRMAKSSRHQYFEMRMLLDSARCLPVADLPQLDAFAATLDEKVVDQFLEALTPLRSKSKSTTA